MSFDKVDNHSNQDKNTFITIKRSLVVKSLLITLTPGKYWTVPIPVVCLFQNAI